MKKYLLLTLVLFIGCGESNLGPRGLPGPAGPSGLAAQDCVVKQVTNGISIQCANTQATLLNDPQTNKTNCDVKNDKE